MRRRETQRPSARVETVGHSTSVKRALPSEDCLLGYCADTGRWRGSRTPSLRPCPTDMRCVGTAAFLRGTRLRIPCSHARRCETAGISEPRVRRRGPVHARLSCGAQIQLLFTCSIRLHISFLVRRYLGYTVQSHDKRLRLTVRCATAAGDSLVPIKPCLRHPTRNSHVRAAKSCGSASFGGAGVGEGRRSRQPSNQPAEEYGSSPASSTLETA